MWKRKQKNEDAQKMYRTKILVKKFGKMEKATFGRHDVVRRMDRQGEVLIWCRKCWICEAKNGTLTDELLKPDAMGTRCTAKC